MDQVLTIWEQESDKIKNYKCPFERWEYDSVFGPGPDIPKTKSDGLLKYTKPDKGKFEIKEIRHYTRPAAEGKPATWEPRKGEYGEHWVCDGKAVYEYNAAKKQLIVRHLPPEIQGKAIADGPLPFLFGAKKAKLKARYFLKVTRMTEEDIWIEVHPRHRPDAANFKLVNLILDKKRFLPSAIEIHQPNGKSRTVYIFGDATVNSSLENFLPEYFKQPKTPFGWKKVIEQPPAAAPARQAIRPSSPRAPAGSTFPRR